MAIEFDPIMLSIKVDEEMTATEFYTQLKDLWMTSSEYIAFPFPLESLGGGKFTFIFYWRFADQESYEKITPHIFFGAMEEPPTAPAKYRTYENTFFTDETVTLEDVLRKVPKNIPNKSVHFKIIDGKVALVVGGVWPNESFMAQLKKHNTDSIRWSANYNYRKALFNSTPTSAP